MEPPEEREDGSLWKKLKQLHFTLCLAHTAMRNQRHFSFTDQELKARVQLPHVEHLHLSTYSCKVCLPGHHQQCFN